VIGLTLVLAGVTKRFVEDPFRRPGWGRPLLKPFALAAVGMVAVVIAAQAQVHEVTHREQAAKVAVRKALAKPTDCFGAAALSAPAGSCATDTSGPLTPAPILAADDKSAAYRSTKRNDGDCFAYVPAFPVRTCTFGDVDSNVNVALVGNSHAGQWLPALQRVADKRHWKVTTFLASRCAFAETLQSFATSAQSQACVDWVHAVEQRLAAGHFDAVVMTNRVSLAAAGHSFDESWAIYTDGYAAVLRTLRAAHVRLVGIHDTPAPMVAIPDCLASHASDYDACSGSRARWLPREPLFDALDEVDDPRFVRADLTDHICSGARCSAVVGGVPVYFDQTHLTATFAATLAPYLEPYLLRAVRA
jgi:hypothetical protein